MKLFPSRVRRSAGAGPGAARRRRQSFARGRNAGMALMDCLIYLVLLALIFGLSVLAFLEVLRNSTELDRVATMTVRALQAGEQWREDVRAVRGTPRLVETNGVIELRLPTANAEISYAFRDGVVSRRSSNQSAQSAHAAWQEVVRFVESSQFSLDRRQHVTAWRWDLTLQRRPEKQSRQLRRVLTFLAVPPMVAGAPVQPIDIP
jgi:hypothetical protein